MTEEINSCIEVLEKGGLILYPTDTVWGIGCDATNEEAVKKVYRLKQRDDSKALICLVANDFMLEKYITEVPEVAWDIIDLSDKPTTIIYDNPRAIAKNLVAPDNTLAVRIASDKFCQYLINKFKKPLCPLASFLNRGKNLIAKTLKPNRKNEVTSNELPKTI